MTINNTKMIIEYIKESELGKNYRKNYVLNYDETTNQSFIIDYTQKYKYVIIPDDEQQQEFDKTRYNYGYVDENELKLLDLTNFKIFKDDFKNEYYMQDMENLNRRWIILPKDWNDDNNSLAPYINEEDVDLLKWIVYLDQNSNRKYIIDERTETNYYLVPSDYMMEFRKYWSKFYKSEQDKLPVADKLVDQIDTSVPTMTSQEPPIIEYVDEDVLATMDLLNIKVKKDEHYNEYYIQNPLKDNHRWIVLPRNWRTSQTEPYISIDDFQQKDYLIYLDAQKRRYIRDDKTNRCFFLVPTIQDHKQSFKYKWSQIDEQIKKQNTAIKLDDHKTKIRTLPSNEPEIRQLQYSPKTMRRHLMQQQQQSNMKRIRSPSNEYLERGNTNYSSFNVTTTNRSHYSPQLNTRHHRSNNPYKSNSSDNLLTSRSPTTTKKSVCFNENVKVSDGTTEYNDKIQEPKPQPIIQRVPFMQAPSQHHPSIQSSLMQQQPVIKPRVFIKPMNQPVENVKELVLDSKTITTQPTDTNTNNEKVIHIKQSGRPGHLIKVNQNLNR